MSRRFRFRLVDVFTDRALQGNPLAVFPEAEGMSEAEMQSLGREMNLSDTAFVLPASSARAGLRPDFRVRIFTPTQELAFAGHSAMGAAWVLADDGRFPAPSGGTEIQMRQELALGVYPLTVGVSGRGASRRVREVTMTQAEVELIHRVAGDEMDELSASLEVRGRDLRWPLNGEAGTGAGGTGTSATGATSRLRMPAVISCGLPILVVPFARLDVLADVEGERAADLARFAETYGADTMALIAPGNSGAVPDADVHARVLVDPRSGIIEDPATGSAAGPIGIFLGLLARQRGATQRVVIEQGVEIGRPSRLVAEVDFSVEERPTEARVTGDVVPIAEGWLTLP